VNVNRLVLWDIDLTLISAAALGASWYGEALRRYAGTQLVHLPSFAGRTERAITTELLTAHGLDTGNGSVERFFAELEAVAAEQGDQLAEHGRALPGAEAALKALTERTEVAQTVATGNLPTIARQKLAAFGLDDYLDFEIGGYGTLTERREDLVAAAIAAAGRKHSTVFAPRNVVVIGDTPADVAGALAHDVTAVAVATGHYDVEQLRAAGAHVVLPDLADTGAVLSAVLGEN